MSVNIRYFFAFLILFITEIIIAVFIKNGFIRFVVGDFLVVIMLYCFLKSFIKATPFYIATVVLLFAYVIEFLQLSNTLVILNLENNNLVNLILGNTFELRDLIAYTFGIATVLIVDKKLNMG